MIDRDICPKCERESDFGQLTCPYCGYEKNCTGCEYNRGDWGGKQYCAKGYKLGYRCSEYIPHKSRYGD